MSFCPLDDDPALSTFDKPACKQIHWWHGAEQDVSCRKSQKNNIKDEKGKEEVLTVMPLYTSSLDKKLLNHLQVRQITPGSHASHVTRQSHMSHITRHIIQMPKTHNFTPIAVPSPRMLISRALGITRVLSFDTYKESKCNVPKREQAVTHGAAGQYNR